MSNRHDRVPVRMPEEDSMSERGHGSGAVGAGKAIRCELVPVRPQPVKRWLLPTQLKSPPPPLVLEVGTNGAVRVLDANTNALLASDWLAQVTAIPTQARYAEEDSSSYKQALLAVHIPGLEPLRIGTRPVGRSWGAPRFRYGWRGWVRGHKEPGYLVADEEWVRLAETFGLGTRVIDENQAGTLRRLMRVVATTWLWWGLPLFLPAGWVFHHFVR
jgi:hypothetical protein